LTAIIDSSQQIEVNMAQLVVRNLDEQVVNALRKRAAEHGRSAEAEHRAILDEALLPVKKKSFMEALASIPDVGRDEDFERVDVNNADDVFN
jgi:plasmid stability protein